MPSGFAVAAMLCAVSVAALLRSERLGRGTAAATAKTAAALLFLIAAVLSGALATTFGKTVFVGLCLCALGDVLLIPAGKGRPFVAGLTAFLLGHLAYVGAFLQLPQSRTALFGAAIAMVLASWAIGRWLFPHLSVLYRRAVTAYITAISLMVITASGATAAGATPILALAAVAFAVSDLSVARNRFIAPGFRNRLWGLPLYFLAQLSLAWIAGHAGA